MRSTEVRTKACLPLTQWGEGSDPRGLVDFAARAEALGYASVWVNDSVLSPRIETLVMLAAVAPLTTRVTLGTAALLPVLRRPVQAAQRLPPRSAWCHLRPQTSPSQEGVT